MGAGSLWRGKQKNAGAGKTHPEPMQSVLPAGQEVSTLSGNNLGTGSVGCDSRASASSTNTSGWGDKVVTEEPMNRSSSKGSANDAMMNMFSQRSDMSMDFNNSMGRQMSMKSNATAGTRGPDAPMRFGRRFDRIANDDEAVGPSDSLSPADRAENAVPLDKESEAFLTKIMKNHFLFSGLSEEYYQIIFGFMQSIATTAGQVVFTQGDPGDACFFIRSGLFAVSINGNEVKKMKANQTFGELALVYSMPRSATIVSTMTGLLWKMERSEFARCMEHLSLHSNKKAMQFFASDMNFSCLSIDDQMLLSQSCTVQRFRGGEEILREGEMGDWMFIIIAGKVAQSNKGSTSHEPTRLGPIIGSVGLIYGKTQVCGFKALGSVICLAIGKSSLPCLSGPILDVLKRSAIKSLLLGQHSTSENIFRSVSDEQLHRIIGMFAEGDFEANEICFQRGDPAQMVLIVQGQAMILDELPSGSCGDVKAGVVQVMTDGNAYGENEFSQGIGMEHHMVVSRRAKVHRILHAQVLEAFGEPLCEVVRCHNIKKVLQDIFLFKNMGEEQLDRTVREFETRHFAANEVVVRQGDPAKHFFLIQKGTICIQKDETVLRTLGCWDYFGERGLLLHEMRSATCQALEACTCLVLDADTFFDIVGMFRKELERRMYLQDLNITIEDLRCQAVVGRGTFGIVRLVHHKLDEKKQYALKAVRKIEVVKKNQQKYIVMEREVNKQCYHPCIMQFIKTFRDKEHVYFLTEFLGGGDLFYAIREIGFLGKIHAQFYSGSIVLALEYLHARGIMYRDLKPENVLLDFNGVAKLVDFGCCKGEIRTNTLIGTPEYMAPEIIRAQGYTCACDWWSLGVMMHEFIVGPLPFGADCEDQMALFKAICDDPLEFPASCTEDDAKSIISSLLKRKVERRFGASARGAKEIKEHRYYNDFNWDALGGGFHEPPFTPDSKALMENWEASDGDLMKNVGSTSYKTTKNMEWSLGF